MMTVPLALVEAVAAAIERLSRPGIEGWGLMVSPSMEDYGDVIDLGPTGGCTSAGCNHLSHNPGAPDRRWVPKWGRVVELATDEQAREELVSWFAYLDEDGETVGYIEVRHPRGYWSRARFVERDEVPDWALARLAEGATT